MPAAAHQQALARHHPLPPGMCSHCLECREEFTCYPHSPLATDLPSQPPTHHNSSVPPCSGEHSGLCAGCSLAPSAHGSGSSSALLPVPGRCLETAAPSLSSVLGESDTGKHSRDGCRDSASGIWLSPGHPAARLFLAMSSQHQLMIPL